MKKDRITEILSKYQETKLKDANTPVLLSGWKSFLRPFRYRYRSDIIGVINARAYHVRTSKLMANVIEKAKSAPHLLIKIKK